MMEPIAQITYTTKENTSVKVFNAINIDNFMFQVQKGDKCKLCKGGAHSHPHCPIHNLHPEKHWAMGSKLRSQPKAKKVKGKGGVK